MDTPDSSEFCPNYHAAMPVGTRYCGLSTPEKRRGDTMRRLLLLALVLLAAFGLGGASRVRAQTPPTPPDDTEDRPESHPLANFAATAVCRDGFVSYSVHRELTCVAHGGVLQFIFQPEEVEHVRAVRSDTSIAAVAGQAPATPGNAIPGITVRSTASQGGAFVGPLFTFQVPKYMQQVQVAPGTNIASRYQSGDGGATIEVSVRPNEPFADPVILLLKIQLANLANQDVLESPMPESFPVPNAEAGAFASDLYRGNGTTIGDYFVAASKRGKIYVMEIIFSGQYVDQHRGELERVARSFALTP